MLIQPAHSSQGAQAANRCCNHPVLQFSRLGGKLAQQAYNDRKQCCTLNECCYEDHVASDITGSLWLTSDSFHCFATDQTDTDTCAECC